MTAPFRAADTKKWDSVALTLASALSALQNNVLHHVLTRARQIGRHILASPSDVCQASFPAFLQECQRSKPSGNVPKAFLPPFPDFVWRGSGTWSLLDSSGARERAKKAVCRKKKQEFSKKRKRALDTRRDGAVYYFSRRAETAASRKGIKKSLKKNKKKLAGHLTGSPGVC